MDLKELTIELWSIHDSCGKNQPSSASREWNMATFDSIFFISLNLHIAWQQPNCVLSGTSRLQSLVIGWFMSNQLFEKGQIQSTWKIPRIWYLSKVFEYVSTLWASTPTGFLLDLCHFSLVFGGHRSPRWHWQESAAGRHRRGCWPRWQCWDASKKLVKQELLRVSLFHPIHFWGTSTSSVLILAPTVCIG